MSDTAIIDGAVRAYQSGYPITDGQARVIAAAWHGGQQTALCSLATSGAIRRHALTELDREIEAHADTPEQEELRALLAYCERAGVRPPVPGWDALWG